MIDDYEVTQQYVEEFQDISHVTTLGSVYFSPPINTNIIHISSNPNILCQKIIIEKVSHREHLHTSAAIIYKADMLFLLFIHTVSSRVVLIIRLVVGRSLYD